MFKIGLWPLKEGGNMGLCLVVLFRKGTLNCL